MHVIMIIDRPTLKCMIDKRNEEAALCVSACFI
jgi:hypothetical protein